MKPASSSKSDSKKNAEAKSASGQMKPVQMSLSFDSPTSLQESLPTAPTKRSARSTEHEVQYASVKRISLVFEGSLEGRPCLTSTKEAMAFFRQYWAAYPANDQERFVVACLDTKHRVQCVVVVTIGTLDASLVHLSRSIQTRPH